MFFKYLTNQEVFNIALAFALFTLATFWRKNEKLSLTLIIIANFILCFTIANIDKFLNLWDEQFHALVAKNLIDNPLKPVLIKNFYLAPEPEELWKSSHLWLHKPPLFLWQMALSIFLFGKTAIAVRLPSILMHSIIPFFIFRIGKITKLNDGAFWGALFFSVAFFPIAVASGKFATDHNDIAFLFYMTASFWSWFEYQESKKKIYLVLIGLFSGGAVLTKWLMGLFVYVMWGVHLIVFTRKSFLKKQNIGPPLVSFLVTMAAILPWNLYAFMKYPNEYIHETIFSGSHFSKAIEGHSGSFFYHFQEGFDFIYGKYFLIPVLIVIAISYAFYRIKDSSYRFAFLFIVLFTYLFFSLAATKLVSFTLFVSPLIFMAFGELLSAIQLLTRIKVSQKYLSGLIILIGLSFAGFLFSFDNMKHYFTMNQPIVKERKAELMEYSFIQKLPGLLPDNNYVIFNAAITQGGNVPIMFFTDFDAYHFIPTEDQIQMIKNAGKKVAVIDRGNLNDTIKSNPDILIIHQ